MTGYILRRLVNAVLVVWAVFTLSFVLLYLLPSDPISLMLSSESSGGGGATVASSEQYMALASRYGLDRPPLQQYTYLLTKAVSGDLGVSMQSGKTVVAQIGEALPETLKLAALSLVMALTIGFAIALAASYKQDGFTRDFLLALPPVSMAIPTFWIGLVLLQIFAFELRLVPSLGNRGFSSLIMPALTLAVPAAATIAQTLSKGLDDASAQPFVRMLKAKGVSRRRIYLRHILHNAAIPALTVVALLIGNIFAGAVVTETVFSRLGIGRLLQNAVDVQDIPLVQGLVVLTAVAYAAINLVIDLVYPLIDPRIRRGTSVGGDAA
ncbi:MAG: ABC transporter permease [Phyllobacterium sp.]